MADDGSGEGVPHAAALALVDAYVAALNAHDPDAAAALVTDDFANRHASALGTPTDGRDAYRAALPRFFAEVPGVRYVVERVAVDGPDIAVAYRLTADGGIDVRGVWWFERHGDRFASRTDHWDALTVLRQQEAR